MSFSASQLIALLLVALYTIQTDELVGESAELHRLERPSGLNPGSLSDLGVDSGAALIVTVKVAAQILDRSTLRRCGATAAID